MRLDEHLPALLLALPLLGAFSAPLVGKGSRRWVELLLPVLSGLTFAVAAALLHRVSVGGTQLYVMGAERAGLALPSGMSLPIRIVLEVDALSALMAASGSLVAFACALFAVPYMRRFSGFDKFASLYFLLVAGMLGMEVTGDLFNFFVFLEIASVASYGLVAFWRDRPEAIEAGLKYTVVSTVAALMVLFAAGFLYGNHGVLNMAAIASRVDLGVADKVAMALLFGSLAMKAGAVPMHMWLPDAYGEAPSCVSALLVSVSQASLYGLFRTSFSLFGLPRVAPLLGWGLVVLGLLSMFVGVTMAIVQKEIKRLMAYHAISQTGYMLLGVGVGLVASLSPARMESFGLVAIGGALYHVINHAMYKGLLFLTAGAVYYSAGTRMLDQMGGLARNMPKTASLFALAAAAIAGLPPVNGFTSKLLIYQSSYALSPFLAAVGMITSVLTLASFVKIFQSAFLGPALPELSEVREVPAPMLAGMALLALAIAGLSLLPGPVLEHMVMPAARALADRGAYIAAVMGGGM